MKTDNATTNSQQKKGTSNEVSQEPSSAAKHSTFETFTQDSKTLANSPETKDVHEAFTRLASLEPIMHHIQTLDDRGILDLYGSFRSQVEITKLSMAEDQFERCLLSRMNVILTDYSIKIERLSLEKVPGEKEDPRTDGMELFEEKERRDSFEHRIKLVTRYSISNNEVQLPTRLQRWIQG